MRVPSSNGVLVLSAEHVSHVTASFTTLHLQSIVARVFISLSSPRNHHELVSPHRTTIDMPEHRALFMPARIADIGTTIKAVSVPLLSGDARGIPASTLVLDEKTGATKALVNARSLTALRTAAGSVLATVLLHPPATTTKFQHLVAFGAGLQIRSHIQQLLATYPSIVHITIVNRTLNDRLTALLGDLRLEYPKATFVALSSSSNDDERRAPLIEAAVRQADCICCATSSTGPLFPSEWVRPGTHIILVGSYKPEMAEVDTALIRRARVILVESRSACAIEAGELIAAGVPQEGMVEVGELLRRAAPAPDVDDEKSWTWEPDAPRVAEVLSAGAGDVTIFKSVGLGVQDVAIAVATVDRAMEMGIGTMVPDFEYGSNA
ncbi:NAD-P-binding protein [Lactarius psammicola]|nr:NAD-P-binding protein [Lactarius psammicola]